MTDGQTEISRRGVVAVVCQDQRLLVIRRSQHVAAPGKLCFPGGGIERGESETEALQREMTEELGCRFRPISRLWKSTTAWHVPLVWWHGMLEDAGLLNPNPDEVESVHWCSLQELRESKHLLSSNLEFLDALAAGHFRIPGI